MGIDRKDVRIVCHFNIPKSMEAFYQESGRAGRDQMPSRSLLYYGMDDRKRMEFILRNAGNKKLQSPGSSDGSSKKSLADFNQMVEYSEGSGCRRKKILENFGEQVPVSLCRKSCDACKHPNLVAKYLEELTSASSIRQKNANSCIFISSSSNMVAEDQFTEFWNRESSDSEEDISDSDDGAEEMNNLARSKFSSKSGLNEKIEFLQRAEENYYQKKVPTKQNSGIDKKAISEALREASKQRLLNALRQTQQRLSNLKIETEASATFLENECYKKYGKTGKTFYNSQVASTVRWLSTSSFEEIIDRLGTSTSQDNGTCKPDSLPATSMRSEDPQDEGRGPAEVGKEEININVGSETSLNAPQMRTPQGIELPMIPSFSEFVDRKGKEGRSDLSSTSNKSLPTKVQRDVGKRRRLQ